MMKINNLRKIREKLGLSQSKLGERLGLNRSKAQARISHYETSRRLLPTDIAYKLIDLAAKEGLVIELGEIYPRPNEAA